MLLLVSWPWTELARVTDGGLFFGTYANLKNIIQIKIVMDYNIL